MIFQIEYSHETNTQIKKLNKTSTLEASMCPFGLLPLKGTYKISQTRHY